MIATHEISAAKEPSLLLSRKSDNYI